jgi:hypothetical protein
MESDDALADLRGRLVGRRFYDASTDESFAVVGVRPPLVLMQYDDGVAWDEACSPDAFPTERARMLGLSEGGIDAERYVPLEGGGPTLADACDDGSHTFHPRPSHLGLDDGTWHARYDGRSVADRYLDLVRCSRCGLSGSVLMEFLGHGTPTVCDRCEGEVMPGEPSVFSPTPGWADATLCGECTRRAEAEYEPFEVACFGCGTSLGTNEDNEYIPPTSVLGRKLGATEETDDPLFACEACRETALR